MRCTLGEHLVAGGCSVPHHPAPLGTITTHASPPRARTAGGLSARSQQSSLAWWKRLNFLQLLEPHMSSPRHPAWPSCLPTRPVTLAILARVLGGAAPQAVVGCSFHPHTFLRYFVSRSPPAARKNVICVAAEPGHTGKYIWSRQSYGRELEQSRAIFICI